MHDVGTYRMDSGHVVCAMHPTVLHAVNFDMTEQAYGHRVTVDEFPQLTVFWLVAGR